MAPEATAPARIPVPLISGRAQFLGLGLLLALALAWKGQPLPYLGALALSTGAGSLVVPWLQRLKAGQYIREDGPQSHLKKAGTPTMGGLFAVPAGLLVAIAAHPASPVVWVSALATLAYGAIGWLDDWQILRYRNNKGISPQLKLRLQFGTGLLVCAWAIWEFGWTGPITTLALPLGLSLPLGLLFWPLALFVFAAESNATNLTDGLDGLASGTGAIVLTGLGILLQPSQPELAGFCAALAGAYIGFLAHNHHKARVFMGDTGSLALGAALAVVGIFGNCLWALLISGGLFLWESLSVILQVSWFKATKGPDGQGQRIFRMAPYHHHLELGGWLERQVVLLFYAVTAALTLLTLALALALAR